MCGKQGGQYLTRLGFLDCMLKDKPPLILTLSHGSPAIKVESKLSHVEMYNIKSISSKTVPNRIEILNDEGHIIHIRPDIGVITFNFFAVKKSTSKLVWW